MLIDFNVAKIWKHPDRPPLTAFAWSTVSRLQVKTHLERTGQFCVWVQRLPWPPKRKDPNKCQASVFQALMIKPQAQLSMDVWSTLQTNNRHWQWCYERSGGSADDDVMEDQVGQLTMMLWKIRWVSWRWCYGRSGGSADDDAMKDQVGQLTMMLWKIRWVSWRRCYGRSGGSADSILQCWWRLLWDILWTDILSVSPLCVSDHWWATQVAKPFWPGWPTQ